MSTLFESAPGDLAAPQPTSPAEDGSPAPASPARRRRRWALWGGVVLVVALVVLVMTWRSPGAGTTAPLDPRNPTQNGAQALARVLESQGVRVDVVRDQSALESSGIDSDTTVFVPVTDQLAEATIATLGRASRDAERLVLVDPERWVLRYLSPEVVADGTRHAADDLPSRCDGGSSGGGAGGGFTDVRAGERLSHSQSAFTLDPGTPTATCWTDADGFSTYLAAPATDAHGPLVLLGSRSAVGNDEIDEEANAAVALRILGHSSRVVWYVPSAADIPTTDESRTDALLPPWLVPSVVVVLLSVLGVMLWRGRRLGRLVREPLPVVVRAVETTESRGRLYRRAKDSGRAGLVLQEATRRRLSGYLGLPPAGPVDTLVHATAAATGLPIPEVGFLLAGPPPATDDDLLGLAARLALLEKEVRRS